MRRGMAVLALLALFSASGCSLLGGRGQDSPSQPPGSSEPAPAPSGTATAPASPAGSAASTAPPPASGGPSGGSTDAQLGPVVATRTTSVDGKPVTVDLHAIVRDGNLAHLQLTVSSEQNLSLWETFGDQNTTSGNKAAWAADGITLVDTAHNKLYLVASDGRGSCLCSQNLGGVELKDGAPVIISASFANPPADMTEIQVQVPNFGVFPHVPIS